MSLVKWGFIGLLALPAAEIATFILVALWIGWLWTFALFIATSLVGVAVLRHSGRAQLHHLRSALASRGGGMIALGRLGPGAIIGGILLIIPGFITDVAGALLLLPWVRRVASAAIGRVLQRTATTAERRRAVIELEPDQWHAVPDPKVGDHRARKPQA